MINYIKLIQYLIYAFFFTLVVSPLVISFIKREKVKQVILKYVESHNAKAGTPTMGGLIFLISIPVVSLICFDGESSLAKMTLIVFLAYGLVGFLDDFIKFKNKQNLGLKPYQKIIFQLLISVGIGFFVYNSILGSVINIPFTNYLIDIDFWIIPLVAIIYLASTNAVNLTDGLDGLAGSTTMCYMTSFVVLLLVFLETGLIGTNAVMVNEFQNIAVVSVVTIGALLSFLVFNCFPAKIFMGDTGSLALGSLVASVAVFSGLELFIPILGIMFVASAVSVIIQVAYYKLTKKRVFLMAPLHHHFEQKGCHEVRITMCYSLITFFVGVVTILLNIL